MGYVLVLWMIITQNVWWRKRSLRLSGFASNFTFCTHFYFHITGFKARFVILESLFVLLLVCAVPIGAHGTVVAVTIANLIADESPVQG